MRKPTLVMLICLLLAGGLHAASAPPGVQIAPAKTWVGIARVTLAVGELALLGDRLEGRYEIRIPFAPMMNDRGVIRFDLDRPLDETLERGGRITGNSFSTDGGKTRSVICEVQPGGAVQISVETDERTLLFKSQIIGAP